MKQRQGAGRMMLDYVPIETVLERLLEVAPDYSIEGASAYLTPDGVAVANLYIVIDDKRGFGTGAHKNTSDPDMALKTATSEAIKNAAKNGFGVALELWDAEHRAQIAEERASLAAVEEDPLTELKNRVADIAVSEGAERTGPAIAAHFGIAIEKLQDQATLEGIVKGHGAVAL